MSAPSLNNLVECPDCGEMLGGGSHYHCARCGESSSMLGHFTSLHFKPGGSFKDAETVEFHACCPGACELESGAKS